MSPKSKLPTVAEMHNRIIDLEHQLIIARNLTDRLEGTIAEQKRTSTVLQAAHDALDEQLGDAKQARDRSDAAWKEIYDHTVKARRRPFTYEDMVIIVKRLILGAAK